MTNSNDRFDRIENDLEQVIQRLDKLSSDIEKSNDRFANYQQATQWVVQLAFSLIASATVIVIVSNVLSKR